MAEDHGCQAPSVDKRLNIVAETNRGHVNNVKLVDYLDEARKDWYHYCILLGVEAVVVHIGTDFKKEVFNNECCWSILG
jgi:hypothetical protein